MPTPEKPPPPQPRRELSEDDREAAHRQYLAAKAILTGRQSILQPPMPPPNPLLAVTDYGTAEDEIPPEVVA